MMKASSVKQWDARLAHQQNRFLAGVTILITLVIFAPAPCANASVPSPDELRRAIAAKPDALDVGATMTQLAEALLSQLSRDGADLAVLYGIPTLKQIERAQQAADEAMILTEKAANPLQHAVDQLAQNPDYADRRDLQNERSSYQVEYLLTRLPLARARSAVLLATLVQSPAQAARFSDSALNAMSAIESNSIMIESQRFSITAAAKLARGDTIDTAFTQRLTKFVDEESFKELSNQSPHIGLTLWSAASAMLLQGRRYEDAQRFVARHFSKDSSNLLSGVVRRDSLAQIALTRAEHTTSRDDRERNMIKAINLLADEDAMRSAALTEIALSKIERILPTEIANLKLPVAGRIARGRLLLWQHNASGAVEALASAWNEMDESNPTLTEACVWPLATALRARSDGPADISRAGRALLALSRITHSPASSSRALKSAVLLFQWSLDKADQSKNTALVATIKQSLRTALRSALERWPGAPEADDWRLRLSGLTGPTQRRMLLESISPGGDAFARARLSLAWMKFDELATTTGDAEKQAIAFTMLQYVEQATEASANLQIEAGASEEFSASLHQATAIASAQMRRFDLAVSEAIQWDNEDGDGAPDAVEYVRTALSLALDDALYIENSEQSEQIGKELASVSARSLQRVAAGRADRPIVDWAILDLARSLLLSAPDEDHTTEIEVWSDQFGVSRGAGDALAMVYAAHGDHQRAFALYRQVVEASRTLDVSDAFFWRAWIGMLDILSDRNESGDRSDVILRRIAQLRVIDSEFGGRLTRRRIESIERAARSADPH